MAWSKCCNSYKNYPHFTKLYGNISNPWQFFFCDPFVPSLIYTTFVPPISETLKEFKAYVVESNPETDKIKALRSEVEAYASSFNMPGLDER